MAIVCSKCKNYDDCVCESNEVLAEINKIFNISDSI